MKTTGIIIKTGISDFELSSLAHCIFSFEGERERGKKCGGSVGFCTNDLFRNGILFAQRERGQDPRCAVKVEHERRIWHLTNGKWLTKPCPSDCQKQANTAMSDVKWKLIPLSIRHRSVKQVQEISTYTRTLKTSPFGSHMDSV